MAVTVETFGVYHMWLIDPPEALLAELRRAHTLRNALVEAQLAFEDRKKEIWSSFPAVADAETRLAAAEETAEETGRAAKAERQANRTRKPSPGTAAALKLARAAVKTARADRRAAISEAHESAKPLLAGAVTDLKAAKKTLYADMCTDGDLYWATFNDVAAHHETAVKRIAADRAAGKPARLRFKRFDGTGSVAVQLQRATGAPQRTPALIAAPDSRYRNVLSVPWVDPGEWDSLPRGEQRRRGRVVIRMRCGSGHIDVPVQAHRMLPDDADITGARLTITKVGSRLRGTVTVTAKLPDLPQVEDGPDVALHLGWHNNPAGGVTVATWRSTAPLRIPERLRALMGPGRDATAGTVTLPGRLFDRAERSATVDSDRATAFDTARDALAAWLTSHGPVTHPHQEDVTISAADVARWRSPARLAWLAKAWSDPAARPEGAGKVAADLAAWEQSDVKLWDETGFGRRGVSLHRRDLYRQVAAVFSGEAGRLIVDTTDVAALAAAEQPDMTVEVETRIARRRATAAPGELRQACVAAATRDGVPVVKASSVGLSRVHAACGHDNGPGDYSTRRVVCGGCGREYDTEASAVALMLDRAASAVA